jgi:2-keto-4-pentenoate hydratase/2-oxohepta-3-ene-1,7-dioic acid hydratase in catechol pathway
MRLVSYAGDAGTDWRCAIIAGGRVIDAASAYAVAGHVNGGASAKSILSAAPEHRRALEAAATSLAELGGGDSYERLLAAGLLGPPIPDPDKIICVGLNYADHASEAGMDAPSVPTLFAKFRNSLTGPEQPIPLPAASSAIDYEGELAVAIGTRCKEIAVADALTAVGGYMPANDVSARDLQLQTQQWLAGKAVDAFAPCGPALVTADEVPDPQALQLTTRVDGSVVQQASTAEMIFSVAEIVAFVSRFLTLEPGDLILTGTPAGVGFKRDPQLLLSAGSVVEVEIASLGMLRNTFVNPMAMT